MLIVELDGPEADVRRDAAAVRALCEQAGSTEIREAVDPAERAVIWAGRKSAFAAVGRICPAYIVQDGVVPRTALGPVLDEIAKLSAESGIRVANVFHAGDGNLHPLVLYDDSSPGAAEAAEELSGAILDLCIDARRVHHRRARRGGGQVPVHAQDVRRRRPGHHAAAAVRVRPGGLCNPGKVFPTPAAVR